MLMCTILNDFGMFILILINVSDVSEILILQFCGNQTGNVHKLSEATVFIN